MICLWWKNTQYLRWEKKFSLFVLATLSSYWHITSPRGKYTRVSEYQFEITGGGAALAPGQRSSLPVNETFNLFVNFPATFKFKFVRRVSSTKKRQLKSTMNVHLVALNNTNRSWNERQWHGYISTNQMIYKLMARDLTDCCMKLRDYLPIK